MAQLRAALADAGFAGVRTYLQSGNVVLDSRAGAKRVAAECERVLDESFGLDVRVVVRTRDELAAVVRKNPLRRVASNPKRYQVTFLDAPLTKDVAGKLRRTAAPEERFVVDRLEVYAWHPEGIARSKLWAFLAGSGLGVTATARNWTTVTKLDELADADA
jgi:uncharacterized protein (DUF1697 family)